MQIESNQARGKLHTGGSDRPVCSATGPNESEPFDASLFNPEARTPVRLLVWAFRRNPNDLASARWAADAVSYRRGWLFAERQEFGGQRCPFPQTDGRALAHDAYFDWAYVVYPFSPGALVFGSDTEPHGLAVRFTWRAGETVTHTHMRPATISGALDMAYRVRLKSAGRHPELTDVHFRPNRESEWVPLDVT